MPANVSLLGALALCGTLTIVTIDHGAGATAVGDLTLLGFDSGPSLCTVTDHVHRIIPASGFAPGVPFVDPPRLPADSALLLLNRSALDVARQEFRKRPEAPPSAVKEALAAAEAALAAPLMSVMQKEQVPPSGDKHDYMSLGPYWWPDTSKADGIPYIRRDGEVNPEARRFGDNSRLDAMFDNVPALALAYAITEDERYAAKAVEQVEHWFLDPATRMNPNLNFGQAIKGVVTGRGIGIIETYGFRHLLDALTLLKPSKAWTPAVDAGMNAWLTTFLTWLQESSHGKDEAAWKNNHGSAYDVQVSSLALYLGKPEIAQKIIGEALSKRIAVQVEPDGSQPLELERTKSWGYSNMNLDALVELAHLGEQVGVDLWHASTADGRSIRSALKFLIPYALGEKSWAWPLLDPLGPERIFYSVTMAADRLGGREFVEASRHDAIARGRAGLMYFFVSPR